MPIFGWKLANSNWTIIEARRSLNTSRKVPRFLSGFEDLTQSATLILIAADVTPMEHKTELQ